jgi:hypothetical protein
MLSRPEVPRSSFACCPTPTLCREQTRLAFASRNQRVVGQLLRTHADFYCSVSVLSPHEIRERAMNAAIAPPNDTAARIVAMTGWRHRKVDARSEYSQLHAVHARLADDMIHSEQYTPARMSTAPRTAYVIFIPLRPTPRVSRARVSERRLQAHVRHCQRHYGSLNFRVARRGQIDVKCAPPTSRDAAETPCIRSRLSRTVLMRRKECFGSGVITNRLISLGLTSYPSSSAASPNTPFSSLWIAGRSASSSKDLRQNLITSW